jgi:hypothetical protein
MIIILSFSDTASQSSVMVCCTTVATFNVSLLKKLGACADRPLLWIFSYGCCCCTGVRKQVFPYVCGACGRRCCVSWRSSAAQDCSGEVNIKKNAFPEDPLGARCALLLWRSLVRSCSLDMTLDEVSFLLLGCNCCISALILYLFFQGLPYAGGHYRTTNI